MKGTQKQHHTRHDSPILHEGPAMAYIKKSPSWGSKQRMKDLALIAEGKEPEGTVWAYDPRGRIFYYIDDLKDYLRRKVLRVVDLPSAGTDSNS